MNLTPSEKADKDRYKMSKISLPDAIRGKAVTKLKRMIPVMSNTLYPFVAKMVPEEHEFRPEIREIRRAMNKVVERERGTNKDKLKKLVELSSMIMQYDDSYFYRLLDFLEELDMDKVKLPFDDKDIDYHRERWNYDFKK